MREVFTSRNLIYSVAFERRLIVAFITRCIVHFSLRMGRRSRSSMRMGSTGIRLREGGEVGVIIASDVLRTSKSRNKD